jgi:very-short-patch-repair endonuclease
MERKSLTDSGGEAGIAQLAARQHGLVTLAQLFEAGLTDEQVRPRVRAGRLHRIHQGVFAVGHPGLTRDGRYMAGVLAGGPGAALCSWSAGAYLGISRDDPHRVHVAVPRRLHHRRGLRFHHRPRSPAFTTVRRGIPVLAPAHILLDLAAVMTPHQLQRAVHEAEVQRLCRPAQIRAALEQRPRARGRVALRRILDLADGRSLPTRSELEDRWLRFLRRHRLPMPLTNARVDTPRGFYEVDCFWPAARLVVELDGHRFHSGRIAVQRDVVKERALVAGGLRVMHVTWADLEEREFELVADLVDLRIGSSP